MDDMERYRKILNIDPNRPVGKISKDAEQAIEVLSGRLMKTFEDVFDLFPQLSNHEVTMVTASAMGSHVSGIARHKSLDKTTKRAFIAFFATVALAEAQRLDEEEVD